MKINYQAFNSNEEDVKEVEDICNDVISEINYLKNQHIINIQENNIIFNNNKYSNTFNNLNNINTLKNNNNNNNTIMSNSHIEENPKPKKKWQFLEEDTYHFKQDIERVWILTSNFDILTLISNRGHYPCVMVKGNDTNNEGNEFKGNLFGVLPFLARVEKCVNLPEIKKVTWKFSVKAQHFFIKLSLFKVTEDGSTVLFWKAKFENTKLIEFIGEKVIKNRQNDLFKTIDQMLESEPINLFQYESAIISGKFEDIWDMLMDFGKVNAIAPNNNCLPCINLKNFKQGEKVSVPFTNEGNKGIFDLKIDIKDERPGWNKWIDVFTVSGGSPKKFPKHTIIMQLTKINKTENQLSISTKFHDAVSTEKIKELTQRKKYLLSSFKDYFDNFYSPSCGTG